MRTADGSCCTSGAAALNGRIVEPQYVAMMNAMMRETLTTGTAARRNCRAGRRQQDRHVRDFRDAWFVGYTSALVGVVMARQRRQFADRNMRRAAAAGRDLEQVHARGAEGVPPAASRRNLASGEPACRSPVARGPDRPDNSVVRRASTLQRSAQRPPLQASGRGRSTICCRPATSGSRAAQNAPREKNFLENCSAAEALNDRQSV